MLWYSLFHFSLVLFSFFLVSTVEPLPVGERGRGGEGRGGACFLSSFPSSSSPTIVQQFNLFQDRNQTLPVTPSITTRPILEFFSLVDAVKAPLSKMAASLFVQQHGFLNNV